MSVVRAQLHGQFNHIFLRTLCVLKPWKRSWNKNPMQYGIWGILFVSRILRFLTLNQFFPHIYLNSFSHGVIRLTFTTWIEEEGSLFVSNNKNRPLISIMWRKPQKQKEWSNIGLGNIKVSWYQKHSVSAYIILKTSWEKGWKSSSNGIWHTREILTSFSTGLELLKEL